MNFRRLLGARGIHFLVTRFGPRRLRSLAFDEKYISGDWSPPTDGESELPIVTSRYLRKGDLLIMGCGGCSVLKGLESLGLNSALGIDLSPEAIRLANRYASEKITFQIADMVSFDCPRSFDVILFSESLYYITASQQKAVLGRLAARLNQGGVFIATFAQAVRHHSILERIRDAFQVVEDRPFVGSKRHLIVFRAY